MNINDSGPPRSALSELLRQPRTPADWGQSFTLWVHDDHVSNAELILNPELFKDCAPGDCLALRDSSTGKRIVVMASIVDHSIFRQKSFQISLHRTTARTFKFHSRTQIYARKLAKEEWPIIKEVLVVFRDQYIARIPMKIMSDYLIPQSLFHQKAIQVEGYCNQAQVSVILDSQFQPLETGVTKAGITRVHFQSEAAKIVIFIELLSEMQHYKADQTTYLDVAIDGFLNNLFYRWQEAKVNHLVTILLVWRTCSNELTEDHYKVLVDCEVKEDWSLILPSLKTLACHTLEENATKLVRAHHGCFLEAVNMSLSMFDKHYLDRDLIKTGMSVLYITASNGSFSFHGKDAKELCRMAKQKTLDIGLILNLICLEGPSEPASLPLFEFDDGSLYDPYWIHYHYYPEEINNGPLPSSNTILEPIPISSCRDSILSAEGSLEEGNSMESSQERRKLHCALCSQRWCWKNRYQSLEWDLLVRFRCLPLENTVVISRKDLLEMFELDWDREYKVAPSNIISNQELAEIELIKKELVDYRIALGFQVLDINDLDPATDALVLAHTIHIIKANMDGKSIRVQSFQLYDHPKSRSQREIEYSARVRRKGSLVEEVQSFIFADTSVIDYPWDLTDAILCGAQQWDLPNTTYWQSRFVLLPAEEAPRNSLILASLHHEILDDEEVRIAGFSKFVEVFHRIALTKPSPSTTGERTVRVKEPKRDSRRSILDILRIRLMTTSLTQFAKLEASKLETIAVEANKIPSSALEDPETEAIMDVEPLQHDSDPQKVALLMQHPLIGLDIRNRRWHWRLYRDVFIGSESVDWILKFFDRVDTREEAVKIGNQLLEIGVWEHIFGTHQFLDGHYFYRFSSEYELESLRTSSVVRRVTDREPERKEPKSASLKPIIMSQSIVVDLAAWPEAKTPTGGLRQWAILHYDSTHNPSIAFHFRLHWLTCPARRIDDVIQSWGRRATQCGFTLIEVPIEHSLVHHVGDKFYPEDKVPLPLDPFGGPIPIKLAFKVEDDQARETLILAILAKFLFVLDYEEDKKYPPSTSYTFCFWTYHRFPLYLAQYIHESGVALIQVDVSSNVLYWRVNRLLFSSAASRLSSVTVQPIQGYHHLIKVEEQLRHDLFTFCDDAEKLKEYFEEIKERPTRKEELMEESPLASKGHSPSISSLTEISNELAVLDLSLRIRPLP